MNPSSWIVLLGGAGFIGTRLAARLLRAGFRVIIVSRRDNMDLLSDQTLAPNAADRLLVLSQVDIKEITADLFDLPLVNRYGIGAVLNLVTSTTGRKASIIEDNVDTAEQILGFMKGIKSTYPDALLLHFGSITEYSHPRSVFRQCWCPPVPLRRSGTLFVRPHQPVSAT